MFKTNQGNGYCPPSAKFILISPRQVLCQSDPVPGGTEIPGEGPNLGD